MSIEENGNEKISDTVTTVDKEGKKTIEKTVTVLKDGKEISERKTKEDQDLINLKKDLKAEEIDNKENRDLDVHDLDVDQLDEKEIDEITQYIDKIHEQNQKSILGKIKKRDIDAITAKSENKIKGGNVKFKKKEKRTILNFEDIDLGSLSPE